MPKVKPSEVTDNSRHPLWRKHVSRDAEGQMDWYETLRGEAISRLRHKDVAAAEAVMERQYRTLPSDDMRSYLRQWAVALRDNTTWDPVWPPLPEHFDGQGGAPLDKRPDPHVNHEVAARIASAYKVPVAMLTPAKPAPTKPNAQKGVSKQPDDVCAVCSKPTFKMHMARHLQKYHAA